MVVFSRPPDELAVVVHGGETGQQQAAAAAHRIATQHGVDQVTVDDAQIAGRDRDDRGGVAAQQLWRIGMLLYFNPSRCREATSGSTFHNLICPAPPGTSG